MHLGQNLSGPRLLLWVFVSPPACGRNVRAVTRAALRAAPVRCCQFLRCFSKVWLLVRPEVSAEGPGEECSSGRSAELPEAELPGMGGAGI